MLFHRNTANPSSPSPSSPPPSPQRALSMPVPNGPEATTPGTPPATPNRRHSFGVAADVANILVKMRSPRSPRTKPSNHIESVSGEGPQSHPGLSEGMTTARKEVITYTDTFTCIGGVNTPLLLRATRTTLLETAEMLGANCLVDEQWKCTIIGPKTRPRGACTYKVQIHYTASAAKSSQGDPHRPVVLNAAKCVPGLMTILKREI